MKETLRTWLHHSARAVRFAFVGQGRASRAEVLAWAAALILLDFALSAAASAALSGVALKWALLAMRTVIVLPSFALFIRRMHDLGLSGWWSLPIALLAIQNLVLEIVTLAIGWSVRSGVEAVTRYLDWLLFPAFALACIAMVCIPGSRRRNRFGPDPRSAAAPA